MVCDSCQSKLTQVIVPAPNIASKLNNNKLRSGGVAIKNGTNKALEKLKITNQWNFNDSKCLLCKSKVQMKYHYCNQCAYKRGICSMCGKKTVDVSNHKMSIV